MDKIRRQGSAGMSGERSFASRVLTVAPRCHIRAIRVIRRYGNENENESYECLSEEFW